MSIEVTDEQIRKIGNLLRDAKRPLKERFRALFTLRNIATETCINEIALAFTDPSALLKHELAYCLGQMQDTHAIPILKKVMEDSNQETIVRHEAAEALGAIGSLDVLPLLQIYVDDPIKELAETCQLAVARISWLNQHSDNKNLISEFKSVDPAPPSDEKSLEKLTEILLDEKLNLFERYRAMFALRDDGSEEAIQSLCKGFRCFSSLFKHEIAFVLGQMAHPAAKRALQEILENKNEHEMVRHECAEALGGIATEDCSKILSNFTDDSKPVVRESCDIALDMCEYGNSDEFQYANGLSY